MKGLSIESPQKDVDEKWMRRAIALARRGIGRVSPNPMVGSVLVQGGVVVGEGYHVYERGEHAEIVAIERAGKSAAGAALYVNLEPCCHQGRTPPCVDRITKAGLRDVFVATPDPNPLVAGNGIKRLQEKGIRVHVGLCREQAIRLNEKFFHFVCKERPFVLLKLALTLDGRIATRRGEPLWITGNQARRQAHRLRYEYDAVLVGVNTILADNPSLNVRWTRKKPITRIVLDSTLRTPVEARLFRVKDPVILFHADQAPKNRVQALARKAKLVAVEKQGAILDWMQVLKNLKKRQITSLLIEGGSQVAASALRAGIVQKVAFFYGPKILGAEGMPGIGDLGIESLNLRDVRLRRFAQDFLVEAYR